MRAHNTPVSAGSRAALPWTTVERDQLLRHKGAGKTWREIASYLRRSPAACRKEWQRIQAVNQVAIRIRDRLSQNASSYRGALLFVVGLVCFGVGVAAGWAYGG